jgi:hypothetical protein
MNPQMTASQVAAYIAAHMGKPPDGLAAPLAADFGQAEPPPPEDDVNVAEARAQLAAIRAECDRDGLRYFDPTPDMDRLAMEAFARDVQASLGIIYDRAGQALAALEDEGGGEPPPDPDAEDWAILLDGAPGLVGREKWLAGSKGSDLFVARNTIVRAPCRGRVTFQGVPVPGVGTIGEMVLTYPDGRAVRFRHVAGPAVSNGATVERGAVLCRVYDASMDRLRWPGGYPTPPDGYQHLDLALASSVYRLNPQGGAGGDVDTYDHVWGQRGGLPSFQVIDRTPGPMQGMGHLGAQEQAAWAAWVTP